MTIATPLTNIVPLLVRVCAFEYFFSDDEKGRHLKQNGTLIESKDSVSWYLVFEGYYVKVEEKSGKEKKYSCFTSENVSGQIYKKAQSMGIMTLESR